MKKISQTSLILAALALFLLVSGTAMANPTCLTVQSRFSLDVVTDRPGCEPPEGLCAVVDYQGSLRGQSEFTGTSSLLTDKTFTTSVVVATGDNVIHTPSGDLYTQDVIVLATDERGEFAELDTIVGGTDDFADATGRLTATGTFDGLHGEGIVVGEICWP